MRVLVDTHTFIWALTDEQRLSRTAKSILGSSQHELLFSLASLWEIAIKMRSGKLNAVGSSVSYVRDEMDACGMRILPIQYEHILHLEALPRQHGDPFDRLLIAQSFAENTPILSKDSQFAAYGVKTIW